MLCYIGMVLRLMISRTYWLTKVVMHVPYCPAVTSTPFATYFQGKEGGDNNEDLRFRFAVKPPLPRIRVLRSMIQKLCCAVEGDNSSIDMPW